MTDRVDDTVQAVAYSPSYIAWIYEAERVGFPSYDVHFVPRDNDHPAVVVEDTVMSKIEDVMELLESIGEESSFLAALGQDRCKVIKFVTHKETTRYCLCPVYDHLLTDVYPGLGVYRLYYQDPGDPEGQFWGLEEPLHHVLSTH